MQKHRQRKIDQMKLEAVAPPSEITAYLNHLRGEGPDGVEMAEELTAIMVDLFQTENGIKFLIMLEKAVLLSGISNGMSDSALRERNAVRNFVLNLRSIVANGKSHR